MLKKNEVIEAQVVALSHEGNGVARHEGMAVFVPMTAVGDRARIKIVKVLRSYAFGIVQELLEPSPHRVENACPVYRRCGGCSLRHVDYSHEVAVKADWVSENMARIGGVRLAADAPIPSVRERRYRNKAQYPVREIDGRPQVGFFSPRSHDVIPVEDCLLQPEFFADICKAVLAWMERCAVPAYDEKTHKGLVRHIYIRHAEKTGQVMVCLVVNGYGVPVEDILLDLLREACPGLATLVLSHNLERTNVIVGDKLTVLLGDGFIEDELCGVRVQLSPLSFYQVNRDGAEALYRAALEYANPSPDDVLLDLYCGAGTIGLSMAHRVKEVIGVEVVRAAVRDARDNAVRAGIFNARFLAADAAKAAVKLEAEGTKPDIVVLDPPRKGCEGTLLYTVAQMKPGKIVYISCNSATLARDCKLLGDLGYRVRRLRAADLFPRTAHVEAVALLERGQ